MKTIFENKITITKEILTEFSKKTYIIYGIKYRSFLLIASILSTCFTIIALATEGLSWISGLMFIASVFFIFMFFKGYILKVNHNYKNFQWLYGELPVITSKFYEEKIEIVTLRSNLSIEYNQVTKILETENLYLLMLGKQSAILNKSGFTIGDSDKFKSFIKEKCKNS